MRPKKLFRSVSNQPDPHLEFNALPYPLYLRRVSDVKLTGEIDMKKEFVSSCLIL